MRLASPVILFDMQTSGYPDQSVLIGAVTIGFVLTALTVLLFYINSKSVIVTKVRIGSILASLVSYLWITIFYFSSIKPYHQLIRAKEAGEFRTVEGQIENFKAGGTERGSTVESFSVNGVAFSYSPYVFGPGFRKSRAVGGPLDNGMAVRIQYSGNCIYRIEQQ